MKTAVLQFQRNHLKRQRPGTASIDTLKTITELRSALKSIEKAIFAVERLVTAQLRDGAPRLGKQGSLKRTTSAAKRKIIVVPSPHLAQSSEASSSADLVDPR
jgi:hypothetical protein